MTQRPLGPVALILLQQAWKLRLQLSGFEDLEDPNDPDGPLRGRHRDLHGLWDKGTTGHEYTDPYREKESHIHPDLHPERLDTARAEYYRRLGIESHRRPPSLGTGRGRGRRRTVKGGLGIFPIKEALDRKIIRLLSEGTPIRDVMARLHVGQDRVYRILRNVQNRIRRETRHGKANG